MKIRCEACTKDEAQQDNLCQCVRILGGEPNIAGDTVSVEYDGEKTETMIKLFETFSNHAIDIHPS